MTAWTVRLTHQAELDVEAILAWTEDHFGTLQAEVYAEVLALAVEALLAAPDAVGARKRDDILPGVRVLHVARHGKRGRHFLIFRASEDGQIDVLRVLHDSMDLARHLGS
ncbi:type II toxin-antitoxin system RelE/ParE family toxin [Thauera sp.]|uniref:type II toxin-antitoxin system RelE/ParE family toxin n=1 Tax=Thauera sp. TaxID=1905334 RepID=UPI002B99440E|nr:type II toxin-antitoxin system RelE/ParE family toxin [Thauera sp.]HRP24446.1 type II toxin-antitoxin system RelE/ParE family toxin [Thauera sp.]